MDSSKNPHFSLFIFSLLIISCIFAPENKEQKNMVTTIPNPVIQDISPVDAIWAIIQSQTKAVRQAIFMRVEAEQGKNIAASDSILRQLSELEQGPEGFLKLDTILPPSKLSIEELREDAYMDKYGI